MSGHPDRRDRDELRIDNELTRLDRRFRSELTAFVTKLGADNDAEDVVQEAFFMYLVFLRDRGADLEPPDDREAKRRLCAYAKWQHLSRRRRDGRRGSLVQSCVGMLALLNDAMTGRELPIWMCPAERVELKEFAVIISNLVHELLAPREREIFMMVHGDKLAQNAVAAMLDMAPQRVSLVLQRAHKLLRTRLEEMGHTNRTETPRGWDVRKDWTP